MSVSRPHSQQNLSRSNSTDSIEELFSDVKIDEPPTLVGVINAPDEVPAQVSPPSDLQSHSEVAASQLLAQASTSLDEAELEGATAAVTLTDQNSETHMFLLIDLIKTLTGETIQPEHIRSIFNPEMHREIYEIIKSILDTPDEKSILPTLSAYTKSGSFILEMQTIKSLITSANSGENVEDNIDHHATSFEKLYNVLYACIPFFEKSELTLLIKPESYELLHELLSKLLDTDNINAILELLNTHSFSGNFMRSLSDLRKQPK